MIRPLPESYTPEYCFTRLQQLGGCVWLDSSMQGGDIGRYSYLAADPFCQIRVDKSNPRALDRVTSLAKQFYQPKLDFLPPMQGGWMGWFGYELGSCFEHLPRARHNEFNLPLASLGLYDVVLCWDHLQKQGWLISQGWPVRQPDARRRHAYKRLRHFLSYLEQSDANGPPRPATSKSMHAISTSRLAPQHPTRWSDSWTSNFSSTDYRQAVAKCVDYIYAGDVFQVNLAQRLLRPAKCDSAQLYLQLRRKSAAPFSGYADFGRIQVISSSPERFVQLTDGRLETRPIKGTRPRLSDPIADAGMGELLQASPKDRAENVMIVDLLRNDLSRVAEPDSLKVSSLCKLEQYPFVWHLVSVIEAQLGDTYSPVDVLAATFPGGSITGAPKIRAMEIIAELEPTVRGPYCGSLGYISFAGEMDLSILIRTITACEGWWQVPVGGGIVADSDPNLEEQETWHKAEGILQAIDSIESEPEPPFTKMPDAPAH